MISKLQWTSWTKQHRGITLENIELKRAQGSFFCHLGFILPQPLMVIRPTRHQQDAALAPSAKICFVCNFCCCFLLACHLLSLSDKFLHGSDWPQSSFVRQLTTSDKCFKKENIT